MKIKNIFEIIWWTSFFSHFVHFGENLATLDFYTPISIALRYLLLSCWCSIYSVRCCWVKQGAVNLKSYWALSIQKEPNFLQNGQSGKKVAKNEVHHTIWKFLMNLNSPYWEGSKIINFENVVLFRRPSKAGASSSQIIQD